MNSIVTMETDIRAGATVAQELDDESVDFFSSTSSNMRNNQTSRTGEMGVEQGGDAVVFNAASVAQSGFFATV